MSNLSISNDKSNFIRDGKPFFYLADTIWSAFTNVTIEEWAYYLKKRKTQGFNVLQINTLPQWDRCLTDVGVYPFETKDGHRFDFTTFQEAYYQRARTMCEMAVEQGFELALIVLWLNFVPDTWGSRIVDHNIMPKEFVPKYVEKVIQEFDAYDPIYVVSGDTDFDTKQSIGYYKMALDILCEKSPDSLKTLHIKRGYDVIPEEFLDQIDFYMFQSGHNKAQQEMAYQLPELFAMKYPKKPMINAEPCYEQMGFSREKYGRFDTADTRKAAWTSILSGACAGVTYGAHGIWNWNKLNCPSNPTLGEGFDKPYSWQEAIEFQGAWDYGFIKHLLHQYQVEHLEPSNQLLGNDTKDIRVAKANEMYFIYAQYNTNIRILKDLSGYQATAYDLEGKKIAFLDILCEKEESIIEMHPFSKDVLIILNRNEISLS